MKAIDKLITVINDHDAQSMGNGQRLPSLQAATGVPTRNIESEVVTKNYETQQYDKNVGGGILPRKFSQVMPAGIKEPLSLYA